MMRFWWLPALIFWQSVLATPDAAQVRLEQAIGDGPDISMYLDARRGDGNPVPAADLGRIEVHVDGQPALVESAVDFTDSGEGVAYIFLVDVSKSLNERTYADIRNALSNWIQAMKPKDMAAIISFGTEVKRLAGFTRDPDVLQVAVTESGPTDDSTRLYQGLKAAMELGASHRTARNVPRRKLIVTLSDGKDDLPDDEVGLSLQEVEGIIGTTRIPVHAIAFNADSDGREVLGKLARFSGGSLLETRDRVHIPGFYAKLRVRINQAIVARARCGACPQDGDLYPLDIRFADGTRVPGELKIHMSPARTTVALPPSPDPEPLPEKTSWIADWRLWAGIGILLALAVAGIAFLGNRRRQEATPESIPEPASPPPPIMRSDIGERPDAVGRYDSPKKGASMGGKPARLSVISGAAPKGQVFEIQVSDNVLLGRSNECQVAIPGDEEISRRHARIDVKSNRLVIADTGSTHGTYVNGVPVHGERVLEDGDILRLGRTELHLSC